MELLPNLRSDMQVTLPKPDIVNEDRRGWILRMMLPDGREDIIIYTRRGFIRGGETHKSDQNNLVLQGALKWTYGDGSTEVTTSHQGNIIPAGKAHMAEAIEDTVYLEWLDGEWEKTYVPEMREIVLRRIEDKE
jgi:quercetin dioxygenase-like cupin family protein